MPVRIRLRRMGAKKRPFYRLVVANGTDARDGRFIETIGYYDPCTEPPIIKVDADKAAHWLKCGAQPSDTARALLVKQGILAGRTAPAKAGATPVAAVANVAVAANATAAGDVAAVANVEVAAVAAVAAKPGRASRKPAETPQAAE